MQRLRWQCRRGLLELDIVLERFLRSKYQQLNNQEKLTFSKLLKEADINLLAYVNQTKSCPDPDINQFIKKHI